MKQWLLIGLLTMPLLLTGCDSGSEITPPGSTPSSTQNVTTPDPVEGKYTLLKSPFTDQELGANKPYLVEFFWFGCPHCYSLEPLATAFKQQHPDFQFITIPAAPNKRWEQEARLYYAMEELGVQDSHFSQVFQLYADKREQKRFPTLEEVSALFSAQGIDSRTLAESMNSPAVSKKIELSKRLFNQAELTGVPSIIVNGKYFVDFSKLEAKNFSEDFMKTILTLGDR